MSNTMELMSIEMDFSTYQHETKGKVFFAIVVDDNGESTISIATRIIDGKLTTDDIKDEFSPEELQQVINDSNEYFAKMEAYHFNDEEILDELDIEY